MARALIRRWLCLLLFAGCATVAVEPAPDTTVSLKFPPPDSRWITRSTDQSGGFWMTTLTVLDPGSFHGKPVLRVSDGTQMLLFDRDSRNWLATLRQDQPRFSAAPHVGMFSWPLEVGKQWTAIYEYQDYQRGRSLRRIQWQWRVAAHEEVRVAGGTFKAYRLEGTGPVDSTTLWYAPEVGLIVKEVYERSPKHYLGASRVATELIRYAPPGGERWYGFNVEATNEAIQRGEGRAALAFYESAAREFESRGMTREAAASWYLTAPLTTYTFSSRATALSASWGE